MTSKTFFIILKGFSFKQIKPIFLEGKSPTLSLQHCFTAMIKKLQKSDDREGSSDTLLNDISKEFNWLLYDFLIARLHAYGVKKRDFEVDILHA